MTYLPPEVLSLAIKAKAAATALQHAASSPEASQALAILLPQVLQVEADCALDEIKLSGPAA